LNKIRQSKLLLLDVYKSAEKDSGILLLKYNLPKNMTMFSIKSEWLRYTKSNLAFSVKRDSLLLLLNSLPLHAQVDTVKH